MKLRMICLTVLLGCCFLLPSAKAHASTPAEVSTGCKAISVALTTLAGYTAGGPFGPAASAVSAAVTMELGSKALAAQCENYYVSLEKQKNNFDYEGFVRTVCGGNPYGCPNGLNSMGSFPDAPRNCEYLVVCNVPLAVRSNASLTVQDLINAGTFVDLSYRAGYWDYQNYGYLVGVTTTSIGGGTGDFSIR